MKIENGKIIIDPIDFLSKMKGDDKIILIEALSCEDEIIQHVSDQIIHGCTENGWYGGKSFEGEASTPLDKAVRAVSEKSSDIAKKEIAKLKRIVKAKEDSAQRAWDKFNKLNAEINKEAY